MKSRRRNESEDGLTLTTPRRSVRLKNDGEKSLPIPIDLVIEIFSRLPIKSIARCRCVSKLWRSILRRPDFTELYLKKSRARPQMLLACHNDHGELVFFSTSQPQNPDENSSPPPAATFLMKTPCSNSYVNISYVNGLVFFMDKRITKGEDHTVIFNPSTGQAFTLPKMKTRKRNGLQSFFGFDPVEKQFKVLSMICSVRRGRKHVSEDHQVLTLGTGVPVWRKIECGLPHYPQCRGISVNGVLYYPAATNSPSEISIIVCFDLKSEMFSFIKFMEPLITALRFSLGQLIDFNGKLGVLVVAEDFGYLDETTRLTKLWVLEDVEREEWSERTYVLPDSCRNIFDGFYSSIGVTRTNEIVLYRGVQTTNFYVLYYNLEDNKLVRVEIQGMEAFMDKRIFAFLYHVEDVKLMHMF